MTRGKAGHMVSMTDIFGLRTQALPAADVEWFASPPPILLLCNHIAKAITGGHPEELFDRSPERQNRARPTRRRWAFLDGWSFAETDFSEPPREWLR